MAKTQFYTATSIDGYIADQDNSLTWLFEADKGGEGVSGYPAFIAGVGALVMGATTYEWILDAENLLDEPGKWPYQDIPVWVLPHRDLPAVPGADLRFAQGDVRAVHAAMTAAAAGKNLWVCGGGDLAGQFADAGLLDELILGVAPVTLGAGAPLLPRRLLADRLTLTAVEHQGAFAILTYAVAPPT
jgi:dihydrofolate reductase